MHFVVVMTAVIMLL